jgi:hypothetical protein
MDDAGVGSAAGTHSAGAGGLKDPAAGIEGGVENEVAVGTPVAVGMLVAPKGMAWAGAANSEV